MEQYNIIVATTTNYDISGNSLSYSVKQTNLPLSLPIIILQVGIFLFILTAFMRKR